MPSAVFSPLHMYKSTICMYVCTSTGYMYTPSCLFYVLSDLEKMQVLNKYTTYAQVDKKPICALNIASYLPSLSSFSRRKTSEME